MLGLLSTGRFEIGIYTLSQTYCWGICWQWGKRRVAEQEVDRLVLERTLRNQPTPSRRPYRRQKFVNRVSMRKNNNSVRDLAECGGAGQLIKFVVRDSIVEHQWTRYISLAHVQSLLGIKRRSSRAVALSWFDRPSIKRCISEQGRSTYNVFILFNVDLNTLRHSFNEILRFGTSV